MTVTYCDKCGENASQTDTQVYFYEHGYNVKWFHLCKLCFKKFLKELNTGREKHHG
jgi:hypothetical protein